MQKIGLANSNGNSFQIMECRIDEMKSLVLTHFTSNNLKINAVCER